MIQLNNKTFTYLQTTKYNIFPRGYLIVDEGSLSTFDLKELFNLVSEGYLTLSSTDSVKLSVEINKRNGVSGDSYSKFDSDLRYNLLSMAINLPTTLDVNVSKEDAMPLVGNRYSEFFNSGDTGYVFIRGQGIKASLLIDVFMKKSTSNEFTKINTEDLALDSTVELKIPFTIYSELDADLNFYIVPRGYTEPNLYDGTLIGSSQQHHKVYSSPRIPTSISTFSEDMPLRAGSFRNTFTYSFDVDYSGKDVSFECSIPGVEFSTMTYWGNSGINNSYWINIPGNIPVGTEFTFTITVDGLSTESGKIIVIEQVTTSS